MPVSCFNAEEIGVFAVPEVIRISPTPWLRASVAAWTLVLMPPPMLLRISLTSEAAILGMRSPLSMSPSTSVRRMSLSALSAPAMTYHCRQPLPFLILSFPEKIQFLPEKTIKGCLIVKISS